MALRSSFDQKRQPVQQRTANGSRNEALEVPAAEALGSGHPGGQAASGQMGQQVLGRQTHHPAAGRTR